MSDLSMGQVEAMAGLGTLQAQTMAFVQATNAKVLAKGKKRLADALLKARPTHHSLSMECGTASAAIICRMCSL